MGIVPAMANIVLTGDREHEPTWVTLALAGVLARDSNPVPTRKELEGEELRKATGLAHVPSRIDDTPVELIDAPWSAGWDPHIVSAYPAAHAAVVVASAGDGAPESMLDYLAALAALGRAEEAAVFLQRGDDDDPELAEVVELEVAEMLDAVGLGLTVTVSGNAEAAARCGCGESSCPHCGPLTLLASSLVESAAKSQGWDDTLPAQLVTEHVYTRLAPGRAGTRQPIAFGTLRRGVVRPGDKVDVWGSAATGRVDSVQVFGETIELGRPGSIVTLVLDGVGVRDVPAPGVIAAAGTLTENDAIEFEPRFYDQQRRSYTSEEIYSHVGATPLRDLTEADGVLRVSAERALPIEAGDGIVLVSGGRVFAAGRLK